MSPSSIAPSSSSARVDSRLQTLLLALCLALAPAVGIGFGRFAYALVLPAMKSDLEWSFSQAGTMGTANAIGYLVGALLTGPVLRHWQLRPFLLWTLMLAVLALGGAALTHNFWGLLFFRALVGFAAAPSFICATGLAARLGSNAEENALAMGLTICGGGLGAILTGVFVPVALGDGTSKWPLAWAVMAFLGLLSFFIVVFATKGMGGAPQSPTATTLADDGATGGSNLLYAYVSYFGFGMGYIAYMTFLVAFVRGLNATSGTVTLVWASLGAAMLVSSWLWKGQLAHNRGGRAMAIMGFCGCVCALLPLALYRVPALTLPILLASAIGFGALTMPVVTAVTVLIRRHLPTAKWNGAIASVTVVFAIGQSIGPVAAGQLSDHFGASASLWWSAALLGLAGVVALMQKPSPEPASSVER